MTALADPSRNLYDEWLELMREFGDEHAAGSGFWADHQPVLTRPGYEAWISFLETEGNERVPPLEGRVKS